VAAASEDDDAAALLDGGYFCPYCGVQAPDDAWFTEEQLALARSIAEAEVVEPMLSKFADDIAHLPGSRDDDPEHSPPTG